MGKWDKDMNLEDNFGKNWTGKEAYRKEMTKRKQRIVKKYGTEPTICYFYYLLNAVDYTGEENLRKSFESIQGQGDEVIVGDYSSTDDTVKIAKEYGFKIVKVPKTPGFPFHMSKVVNKIIKRTDCNFLVDLDVHIEYPINITRVITDWIRGHDIKEHLLALRGKCISEGGVLFTEWGFCSTLATYRPYLLEARGYDERTYMGHGCTFYFLYLMTEIYDLNFYDENLNSMVHKYHWKKKVKVMKDLLKIDNLMHRHKPSLLFARSLINNLKVDFDKGVKNVKNSYW